MPAMAFDRVGQNRLVLTNGCIPGKHFPLRFHTLGQFEYQNVRHVFWYAEVIEVRWMILVLDGLFLIFEVPE